MSAVKRASSTKTKDENYLFNVVWINVHWNLVNQKEATPASSNFRARFKNLNKSEKQTK